jgi:hypothetical protein
MNDLTPAAGLFRAACLAGALLCAGAWAQQPLPPRDTPKEATEQRAPEVDTEKESYAKLPPCKLSDDGKHLAEEPCRTAKALDPMPRRPMPQAIERTSPVENDPRDSAKPRSPVAPTPPTPPRTNPESRPGAPIPTAGCDGSGCFGPNGQRYNNGPGATVVSPSGKLCSRAGAFIQC